MKKPVLNARQRAVAALALGLSVSPLAFSQAPALAETVVTATRADSRADELVSEVQVIDRAAIEASTARTLPELLARQAGLQFASNGSYGQLSSVFIRGTESRHTILLVDGVRLGSATTGTPVWETIPLESIERIEVLKGPGSALYGSEGVGGVVQVFTRKGREGFHPRASVTAGSRRHAQAAAGIDGGAGGLGYALGVQRLQERGFSATNENVPFGNFNPDRDSFRQDALNASARYDLGRGWRADASLLYADGLARYDEGPGVDSRAKQRASVLQAGLRGTLMPGWVTELRTSEGADTYNPVEGVYTDSFKTTQTQWTWQNHVGTPLGLALAGLEQRVQKVDSTTDYDVKRRTIDAAFVGLNGQSGAHSWQANLRQDRNSQFGSDSTGFVGYGLRLARAWRAHASYGTSFVAPSFNQLYYPGFSNPSLQPERGRNRELGLAYAQGGQELKLVRFDNRIRGFIADSTTPENIARTRIDGWTLGYTGQLQRLALRASYDALDPRNQVTDRLLPRRARHQATVGTDVRHGSWRFGTSVLHVGQRYDDAANTRPLGAYTTVDVYADWQFERDLSLQFKVNNLADKQFETAYGYNQPGRGAFVTLRWQPK